MNALLDILQGHQPEELSREPASVVDPMFEILLELATENDSGSGSNSEADDGRSIHALSGACLLSLAVAYGDTGKLLTATSALLMSPASRSRSSYERIVMPSILASLQRSVLCVMLGQKDHPGASPNSLFN